MVNGRLSSTVAWGLALGVGAIWGQTVSISGISQPSLGLVDDGGVLKSEAVLTLTAEAARSAWVRIAVPGKPAYMESLGSLAAGTNTRTVHVAELDAPTADVTFQVFGDAAGTGSPLAQLTRSQKRIRRWKIYVATDCHVDIGYTHYQEELKKVRYPRYLDSAFLHIDATAAWPVESRFTYPIESSFMVLDGSMLARDADWHERLKGHLRSGRMSYPPGYFNYNTETMGTEELARAQYMSGRHLKDMLGIAPVSAAYMTDNPSLSWSFIDALAESGVKAYRFRFNPGFSRWDVNHYPRLFFIRGRNPANKVLIWNGRKYWHDNAELGAEFGFKGTSSANVYNQVMAWFAKLEQDNWSHDAWLATFTVGDERWVDNTGISVNVMQRIKGVNDLIAAKGWAYPKVIASNHVDFFDHILATSSLTIPTLQGNVESWWNLGAPSTAYELGRAKGAQDKLAMAETFAAFASVAASTPGSTPPAGGVKYPHDRLATAWRTLFAWDEHTWGPADRAIGDQWNWKRNTALVPDMTADSVLGSSFKTLASRIKTAGPSVVVFNGLSFERGDLVRVPLAELPPYFDLVDPETQATLRYQKLEDGHALFLADKVPALGYKVFRIEPRKDEPVFPAAITATATTLENAFFKVSFDSTGSVASILDKRNGNREWVDAAAPARLNQVQVNEGNFIRNARLIGKPGAMTGSMTADGVAGSLGLEGLQRKVILYADLPRIDIENDVLKAAGGDKMDFHFAFPFNVDNYVLRHEMPTGALTPGVNPDPKNTTAEQFYTSSTDHYAVNRWVDISDGKGFGITFAPLTAPLTQYGGRRTMKWDVNYNHKDPWIWSMIYNNHWFTNFQAEQPGTTRFRYSLQSHAGNDWAEGGAPAFGMATATPLRGFVLKAAQAGPWEAPKGSFLGLSPASVVLTTAKSAEANGDGMILRFSETAGRDTKVTVDLGWLGAESAVETDLIENDRAPLGLAGGKLTFDIHAHGWKTVRILRGAAPPKVAGVKAETGTDGCRITWTGLPDTAAAYYEVFRGTGAFEAGTGSYLSTTSNPWYFDTQVPTGQTRAYTYRIRAVRLGRKGPPSEPAAAAPAAYADRQAPTAPILVRVERLHATRVSLEWTPATDDKAVAGYDIYRDGQKILTVDPILNSHLDISATPWSTIPLYQVVAFDKAGNRSPIGTARPHGDPLPDWINVASKATVTASSEFSSAYARQTVVDGVLGRHQSGEWASMAESKPWVRLTWPTRQAIRAVVLFDRSNTADNILSGTLTFSDGSRIQVTGITSWGDGKLVTFPWKEVDWVQFQGDGGAGANPGLSEVMVFGENRIVVSIRNPVAGGEAWRAAAGSGGVANSNGGRKRKSP